MFTTPTKDDWTRGCLYAIAMGTPLLLDQWIARDISAFIALGAMFTLRLDPRCQPKHQIMAMMGGMLLMISAGILGKLLVGYRELAVAALLIFSFIAGQPKPELSYFSLLGKFVAAALVLEEVGFPATLTTVLAYLSGALLALFLTLMQSRFFPTQATSWSPSNEWRELLSGHFNGPLYGFTLPLTILAAMLTADWLNAQHASWVGLTVLFVMHVDAANAWGKIGMRIAGTLLGVICAYIAVSYLPSWSFPYLIMLAALLMPTCLRQNYLLFSWLITMVILLVVDLAMLQQGGDEFLIQWRFIDTLIGCAWVAVSLTLLRLGRKWWPNQPDTP
ncbi:hypothetical protein Shal_1990 [Shewanella halifaxensis HAW-EB4]|uniref:Integral membrane bound transporter domain-containing protein n=1 Tax=Shewanella halifaxensis (strain HAW-EB4) TaxID=458817 RepID=B0TSZ3_SHEHH|nr:FUSC family protein [Shewanella halifaxensis]ABZ76554.1 hypothetical protein Shal_1990 [Shewanella halifaxensis HAW-EB4]